MRTIALLGNPNSGKTSIFNRLTGLRQKVANYPGVTVERHVGAIPGHDDTQLVDLPGCYSLVSRSLDEQLARDTLFGWLRDEPSPDAAVVVIDASNLERNLFLVTQILELGLPTIVVCNMVDVVRGRGDALEIDALSKGLGAPVVATNALDGEGIDELRAALGALPHDVASPFHIPFDDVAQRAVDRMADVVRSRDLAGESMVEGVARVIALPSSVSDDGDVWIRLTAEDAAAVEAARSHDDSVAAALVGQRYAAISRIVETALTPRADDGPTFTDRVDRFLTHRVWGLMVFALVMGGIFLAVFSGAGPMMDGIETLVGLLAGAARSIFGEGVLADLIVDGVIAGVGNVVIFVPQIAMLFLFIALLEDSGYMARAAFVMDRVMAAAGLHGRSFIPMLSSFACAVPAIMATRTIDNRRDRLTTILVAPLMSCSARLPVYIIIISAVFAGSVWLETGILFAMYVLGAVTALIVAAILKRTVFKGPPSMFLLELPPYRRPRPLIVLREMWEQTRPFITQAGTVILAFSVLLWAMAYYPRAADGTDSTAQLKQSYIGKLGHAIEPVIEPLGFDWKIGVGLASSFAAREVFVATMGVVYGVGDEEDETSVPLREQLATAKWPDGRTVLTPLVGVSLMVFYVFACQCMSTLAVVKRETGGWRWPIFMFCYMTGIAYGASFVVYQGGLALGLG